MKGAVHAKALRQDTSGRFEKVLKGGAGGGGGGTPTLPPSLITEKCSPQSSV